MKLIDFLNTPEAKRLHWMWDNYVRNTDRWDAYTWRARCVRYACFVTALELFFDEECYNGIAIRDDATAEEIWEGLENWYAENPCAAEILADGDGRATQFDEAFESVRADESVFAEQPAHN